MTESEHVKMLAAALERQRAEIDRRDRIIGWLLLQALREPLAHGNAIAIGMADLYRVERPYIVRETGEGTERMLTLELEDHDD